MSENAKKYRNVLIFFILEVLAFVSFNLANMYVLLVMLGLLLAFALFLFRSEQKEKGEKFAEFALFSAPLVIYALLTMFSNFSRNQFSLLTNILVGIGLLSYSCIGYLARRIEGFKIKNAMIVIYGGLAVLLLISFIYSMVRYVPFYTLIYNNMYIYYNGTRSTIYDSIKMLMGFEFYDVSIEYFSLFSTLLFSSVVALRFINPKNNKKEFFTFLGFALFGFICLLFTINRNRALSDALVLITLSLIAFIPKKNTPNLIKYAFLVVLGILGVLIIFFVMNALGEFGFVANNSLLNRLFNTNPYAVAWKSAVKTAFSASGLLGFVPASSSRLPSGNFVVDSLMTSGLFGTLALVAYLVFAVKSFIRYFKVSKDTDLEKHLVLSFVLIFFVYSLFSLDIQPYKIYSNYIPMSQNHSFLLVLFLISYVYTSPKAKVEEVVIKEEAVQNEENA